MSNSRKQSVESGNGAMESDEEPPKEKHQKENDSRYQQFVQKISEHQQYKLKNRVTSHEHIRRLAKKMTSWEGKHDLFDLDIHEVNDIKEDNKHSLPVVQRIAVINNWKSKNGPVDTYGRLLQIFICGNFADCASKMVKILNEN